MKHLYFVFFVCCTIFVNAIASITHAETIIPRKLLIAYQSQKGQTSGLNIFFEICQTITDYYGLLSDYIDVNTQPLPDDPYMSDYRAIVTAFNTPEMTNGSQFLKWLNHQCDNQKKLIILGMLSGRDTKMSMNDYNSLASPVYAYIGLKYEGMFSSHQGRIRYKYKDKNKVEFERNYPLFPKAYEKFAVIDKKTRVWLSIIRKDLKDSESAAIITHPNGGFIKASEMFWMDPVSYKKKWYVNPFLFFEEALSVKDLPRFDPTTINGRRVAISHIDGDAFSGYSRINQKITCAEIIRDHVLKKYNYPITVSVIVGEIEPQSIGSEELVDIAKNIYDLPNIEPASHAYSHPFFWNEYSKDKGKYPHQYGILIPDYKHDPEKEIVYSVNYITKKLVAKKNTCKVMLWTGACDPTERELKLCKKNHILNMNGGDTVYDNANDSYTAVAPLYRKVGSFYQIHCGQANENILTNLWEGPYYGYREIIKTMKNTNVPRRLKPIDIYYHFYSGEYKSSLKAVQSVYEWVLKQEIALMYTSEYIKMVNGFIKASIKKNKQGDYILSHYDDCLTVRFDHSDVCPDLNKSLNVIGYRKVPQGLYISLKPGTKQAIVSFLSHDRQAIPYIESATGWVMNFQVKNNHILLNYKGFGKGIVSLGALKPNHLYIINKDLPGEQSLTSDENGRLDVIL